MLRSQLATVEVDVRALTKSIGMIEGIEILCVVESTAWMRCNSTVSIAVVHWVSARSKERPAAIRSVAGSLTC